MLHFTDVSSAQKLCECLAAPARVEILKLVLSHRAESLDSIAKTLHLTNGAITQHVKKLCDAGLIKLVETSGKRGIAKRCAVIADRIIIDIASGLGRENEKIFDIPIGSFSAATVKPYCALAAPNGFIGERDDPRYFTYPERADAFLMYFNSGKVSWTLPASDKRKPVALALSFEISSKPYGHGRSRDTDVVFYLNDRRLGAHTVDGEFTDRRGMFTPSRYDDMLQYGKYKTVTVDKNGVFFDGDRIGDISIDDIDTQSLVFSLSTENGVALFGKGYGDYDCGLRLKLQYE